MRRAQLRFLNSIFIEYNEPYLTLEVHCSKGTYIRTLVDDLGEVLGCGAHVTVLRRTAVADYPTEKMMTWDALQALAEQGDLAQLDQHLLPTDTAVSKLPALQLNAEQSKGIGFGQRVKICEWKQNCVVKRGCFRTRISF